MSEPPMSGNDQQAGFLSRWSRRKARFGSSVATDEAAAATDPALAATAAIKVPEVAPARSQPAPQTAQPATGDAATAERGGQHRPAPPTLDDVAALTRESDFSRFVTTDVSGEVRNAALKKLFGQPQFNVMDGLDVYIDDYSKPDPLPASIARQLMQTAFLGFVEVQADPAELAAAPHPPAAAIDPPRSLESLHARGENCAANAETDENADLRLQSHDAAGCGGAEDGAAADGLGQH